MRCLITGSLGLVGSEAVRYYLNENAEVFGIDNDMRKHFFGPSASVAKNMIHDGNYRHLGTDFSKSDALFREVKFDLIVHCAAQPSHDWAAKNPMMDFGINAYGTLQLLELTRTYSPEAVFVYLSTNKVYGDWPNHLPVVEQETRYEHEKDFDETMPIDQCMHSLFGVSKLAGDLLVQEYARYFGMKTVCFRCGCITGARQAGAELHGFLSYMVKCKRDKIPYKVYGYKGKQVRDQIHANDLVKAIDQFYRNPRPGEVYNMGGGRHANISVLEALNWLKIKDWKYVEEPRKGDHIWYISDLKKFKSHYPGWKPEYTMWSIMDNLQNG